MSSSRVLEVPTHYLLFDLDGTLVNTTPAVEYFWRAWAVEYGLDGDEILKTSHGRRSLDVIKEQLPHRPDMHTQEYVNYMEKDIPYNLSHMALPIPVPSACLNRLMKSVARWLTTNGPSALLGLVDLPVAGLIALNGRNPSFLLLPTDVQRESHIPMVTLLRQKH